MSSALRKALLLKAQFNEDLLEKIESLNDQQLATTLMEVMEKMASQSSDSSSRKKSTNFLLSHFSEARKPFEDKLLHSAMSHHASRAIYHHENGNKAARDEHAFQFIRLNDLARRLDTTDHPINHEPPVSLQPWQANIGDAYKEKASGVYNFPGWNIHHPDKNYAISNKGKTKDTKQAYGNYNFEHLFEAPNKDHAYRDEKGIKASESAFGPLDRYPMELTKLNGKYIKVKKEDSIGSDFEPHPFDSHPIMKHFATSNAKVKEEDAANYSNEMINWLGQLRDSGNEKSGMVKAALQNHDTPHHPVKITYKTSKEPKSE